MEIYQKIIEKADALAPAMTTLRRDLHKHAEPGWLEMRTSSIIARKLTELGYEVLVGDAVCKRDARMGLPSEEVLEAAYQRAVAQGADPEFIEATRGGMTGVIGILRCGEGPTVAMRFDIDALGVFESEDADHIPHKEGFASINRGAMHACGHDGHAVSGLGVAKVLMDIRDQLHGTVKLIFQPAEEGLRGAKAIVENGHLDDVDFMLGSHVTGENEEGSDLTPGSYGSLASYKYDVTFHGVAAHAGGNPQAGKNALLAAACAVTNLYAIPRHSGGATRINVGKLIAGSGRNVIADEAFMELEVRGDTTEINEYVSEYALRVLKNAAEMHGCTMEIKLMGAAESMTSDDALAKRVARVCAEKLGMKVSSNLMMVLKGSEDVSYMMNRVQEKGGQACFIRVRTPLQGIAHNRRYNFDESYLPRAVKVFCGMVYDLLK
ncbi:MAG: amidohydrolase [Clostridia bacterium]|nr:amidohydrolase [Clostridia bacterium]